MQARGIVFTAPDTVALEREAQISLGDSVAVLGQGIIGLLSAKFAQFAGGAPVGGPGTSTIATDKATLLTMLALKRFDVLPFVTHRLAASEMPSKFLRLVSETQGTLGVIIRWDSTD